MLIAGNDDTSKQYKKMSHVLVVKCTILSKVIEKDSLDTDIFGQFSSCLHLSHFVTSFLQVNCDG